MKGSLAKRFARVGALLTAGLLGTLAMAGPTALAAAHPDTPGNNGTVKIHDGAGEPSPEVRNQPHVCTFHLHFFFADPEQSGTWEIQEWSPGDKGVVVLTGTYDTVGDGQDRQPETGAYSLPDGHYKLFWDGDTAKHDKMKVFWVRCAPTTPVTAATPTPTPASGGQPAAGGPTSTPGGAGLPAGATPTPTPNENNGNVGGIGGSPAPGGGSPGGGSPGGESGEVLGVTGTPPPVTPPPTDTAAAVTSSAADGWPAVLLTIAGMIGAMAVIGHARLLPVALRRSERRRFR
jgi:hypothetical protein